MHPTFLHKLLSRIVTIMLAVVALQLSVIGAAAQSAAETRAAMEKATAYFRSISMGGGYLWWYSEDLQERAGEVKATPAQVWVQPPGTPSVGMAFVRAWKATRDARYLEAARAAALALAHGQLASGGWDYSIDFDPKSATRFYRRGDVGRISAEDGAARRNITTFDDDNTQSAIRFLLALADAAGSASDPRDQEIREALDYGLGKMIEAQYPNGAWPQRYDGKPRNPADYPVKHASIPPDWPRIQPPGHQYAAFYTFNDHTIRDCILTMLEAHRVLGEDKYLASAKKGGDFMMLAQLPAPQSAWAQQYNPNMEPDWARAFEPPAVCSAESGGVIRTLLDLHIETGDPKYLKPIPPALEWFNRSQMAPNTWARFYELGTNTPIYGDRDGKIHYRLEEISQERRDRYSWRGNYGISDVIQYWQQLESEGRAAMLERRHPAPLTEDRKKSRAKSLQPRVKEIIAALDPQGRWITRGRIESRVFIANLNSLSEYVAAVE